jgi:hypothetical protein
MTRLRFPSTDAARLSTSTIEGKKQIIDCQSLPVNAPGRLMFHLKNRASPASGEETEVSSV